MGLPRILCLVLALGLLCTDAAPAAETPAERVRRALSLIEAGEIDKARSLLRSVLSEDPSHGPAHLQLARIDLASGDDEAAEEHLKVAVRADSPGVFLAWHLLGRVYLEQGAYDEAQEALRQAIERAPGFLPARLSLAELSERLDNRWEALALYREVLESSSLGGELPGVQARAANLARTMGATGLATCYARKAVALQPENARFHHLLAVILDDAGDVDAALAACRKAITLGMESAAAYVTLGNLYYRKMQLGDAISALGRALELDPAAAESIASFALTSLTTDEYAALRSLLETHVRSHPESPNTLYGLGAMHLREGQLDEAERYFTKLATLAPGHAQVHYNLGLISLRKGRSEEGRAAMARFHELKEAEDREWIRQNRAHARRLEAREAEDMGDWETAIARYSELATEGTAETDDLVAWSRALLKSGNPSRAYDEIRRVLATAPYHEEALRTLADAAAAVGDREIAAQARRFVDLLQSPCQERGTP